MNLEFLPTNTRDIILENITKSILEADDKRLSLRFQIRTWLKPEIEKYKKRIEHEIGFGFNGILYAQAYSNAVDALLCLIFDIQCAISIDRKPNFTLVATGGYGRNTLAPFSDIDLLFLIPPQFDNKKSELIEDILYVLWDLGFKVGHATRTIEDCLLLSIQDATIRTSLLDARMICGNDGLFAQFEKSFSKKVLQHKLNEYVLDKIHERKQRFIKYHASRYRVEPNIKEGRGGLRDLHLFRWMFQSVYQIQNDAELVQKGFLEPNELSRLHKAERFLWTVRFCMHFVAQRPEEQLTFDIQTKVAQILGYKDEDGRFGVERFMRHYFIVAHNVGSLMTILWSNLEKQELKPAPILAKFASKFFAKTRVDHENFFEDAGRVQAREQAIEHSPYEILNFYDYCTKHQKKPHPITLKRIRRVCQKTDVKAFFLDSKEAKQHFLKILTAKNFSEKILRSMHEVGLTVALIPEFAQVVCRMQFNAYHYYTVDEHLIRTIGCLKRLEAGQLSEGTKHIKDFSLDGAKRQVLYLACFIHDIAKGQKEDHSILGAKWALEIAPRMGLSKDNAQLVSWLVEQHLLMSETAQSRDLADAKTIQDFAKIVDSLEKLRLLYMLTLCDIAAVGPQKLSSWKEELLGQLYAETSLELGSHEIKSRSARISDAKSMLFQSAPYLPKEFLEKQLDRPYPSYWLQVPKSVQVVHAQLFYEMETSGELIKTHIDTDFVRGLTEITIIAPDHPRLLASITGACAAKELNIIEARIDTTHDGFALDTIAFARSFDTDTDEIERASRIALTVEKIIRGEKKIKDVLPNPEKKLSKNAIFNVDNIVKIENDLSLINTVIEIECLDRPGLLYEITTILSQLNLNIHTAKITTYGEKAIDVFYVSDLTGAKITNKQRQKLIRQTIQNMLLNPLTLKTNAKPTI